jgi:hypothetical protein
VIDPNTQARDPPSVRATVSSRRSIAAIDRRIARTEEQQQGESDDDRRQDQRQVNDRVEQRLTRKIGAREHVGEEDRRREAASDADQRHLETEQDNAEFGRVRHRSA